MVDRGAALRRTEAAFETTGDDLGFRRTVLALREFGLPYILEARHMLPSYEDPRHDLLDGRWKPVAVMDGTSFWRKADSLHC